MALTPEQIELLKSYLSLVKPIKEYTLTTDKPVTWIGKVVNIKPLFNSAKKTIILDIPISQSTPNTTPETPNTTSSPQTPTYTTSVLRASIELDQNNIEWLLANNNILSEIATAFFNTVKQSYLQTKSIPQTLQQFINKTF